MGYFLPLPPSVSDAAALLVAPLRRHLTVVAVDAQLHFGIKTRPTAEEFVSSSGGFPNSRPGGTPLAFLLSPPRPFLAVPPPSRPCVSFNFSDLKGSRCSPPSPSFPNPASFCFPSMRALEKSPFKLADDRLKKRRAAGIGVDAHGADQKQRKPPPPTSLHLLCQGGAS